MAVTAIHPGEHLSEELRTLGMSAAELARKLEVPTNRITQIVNGERAVTGDTALRLAHFFGTSPEFWLNLQSLYELRMARRKAGRVIQALPTLSPSAPISSRKNGLRELVRAITPRTRHNDAGFEGNQGNAVSRGARRTK